MSGTRCSICLDPRRAEIDAAHLAGVSIRDLAKRFGKARSTLAGHVGRHIADAARRAVEATESRETTAGAVILAELDDLRKHASRLMEKAERGEQRVVELFREYQKDLKKTLNEAAASGKPLSRAQVAQLATLGDRLLAMERKDVRAAVGALREMGRLLELKARILGEIRDREPASTLIIGEETAMRMAQTFIARRQLRANADAGFSSAFDLQVVENEPPEKRCPKRCP